MLVKNHMSSPAVTATPDMPMQKALGIMRQKKIRRLPVVNEENELIGIITERDILQASPSEATTLDVWELTTLMSKMTVKRIMKTEVVAIEKNYPIESAAVIMADNQISTLPVVEDNKVIGLITETDIFKVFIDFFGAREKNLRLTARLSSKIGSLTKLIQAINDADGYITALGAFVEDDETGDVTVRVSKITKDKLVEVVTPVIDEIINLEDYTQS
ncbi:MAG: CBS domain-containing protein [Anaerolineales bacterium]|nr:CBS domain-containing protein [Anaerolineales bacterium]